MVLNQKITIENGQVQKTNENFRTPYSMFEIRLTNNTNIQSYISSSFAPNIKITKTDILNISELLNGMNADVEGQIIFDNNISTTIGGNNGIQLRRISLKIKDQTGTVNITVWNNKVTEDFVIMPYIVHSILYKLERRISRKCDE
ncbi:unnamed protein product [Adineta steineri]|uniref:Uncharacterized protein n=1 Tax=Adineta steineri TaxID=433720 RepID=A0A815CTJ6_9BILA|nr:unnamed protein product [Adineta steineri]